MTNYTRGRQTEYEVRDLFGICGYEAIRTAGSHSPVDILSWNSLHLLFNQIKRVKVGNAFYPTPAEIKRFKDLVSPDNTSKWIITRMDGSNSKEVEWRFQCIKPETIIKDGKVYKSFHHPLIEYFKSKGIKYSIKK